MIYTKKWVRLDIMLDMVLLVLLKKASGLHLLRKKRKKLRPKKRPKRKKPKMNRQLLRRKKNSPKRFRLKWQSRSRQSL